MDPSAVVVLVWLALLIGAAFGAWCAWPKPPAWPEDASPSPSPAPAPSPTPPPPPTGLHSRFLPLAQQVTAALAEAPPEERVATMAGLLGDHWQLGVSELRQELVVSSTLSPVAMDHLTHLAILALEARHAAPQGPR